MRRRRRRRTDLPPALVFLTAAGLLALGVAQVVFVTRHQLPVSTAPALLLHLLSHTKYTGVCACARVCVRVHAFMCVCQPVCMSHSSPGGTSLNRCVSRRTDGAHMCHRTAALPPCTAETTLDTHVRALRKQQTCTTVWTIENVFRLI